jgi:hypothetical protein
MPDAAPGAQPSELGRLPDGAARAFTSAKSMNDIAALLLVMNQAAFNHAVPECWPYFCFTWT